MIPQRISQYLEDNDVPYEVIDHPRAVSAQMLAQAMHQSGHRVAKSVLLTADGGLWLAVLPACERLDPLLLSGVLGARHLELCSEAMMAEVFPDAEVGAEPPFGGLYDVPVVMDLALAQVDPLIVRAGSHEQALRIGRDDFLRLESPQIGAFSVLPDLSWTMELEARP